MELSKNPQVERKPSVGIRPALPFVLLFGLFLVIGARLFYLQVLRGGHYEQAIDKIVERTETLPAPRGRILDREGRVLAFSRPVLHLVADPQEVEKHSNPKKIARAIAPLLSLPVAEIEKKLTSSSRYRVIKRRLEAKEALAMQKAIKANRWLGFTFEEETLRSYPYGPVAAQVLGFCGPKDFQQSDGKKVSLEAGLYGVESRYDNLLRGKEGKREYLAQTNPFKSGLYLPDSQVEATPGCDLILSVDALISSIAHEELKSIVEKFKPQWASAIVLDPQSGEILAMENYPFLDPNDYSKYPVDSFLNRSIAWTFTPGSSLKPFVMASALELGLVNLNERIDCENGEWLYKTRRMHDHEPEGILTPKELLARSSNIGMAKIGLRIGIENMDRYLRHFEFARKTGVELPGEVMGQIPRGNQWSEVYSLCSVSFGHEVSATPLRLASSFCLFANDGDLVETRLLRGVIDAQGQESQVPPARSKKAISEKTLATVRDMLGEVMRTGTGEPVASRFVSMGGKTGTTVKDSLKNGKKVYTSSFVGFAPLENPKLVVLVVVDEPRGAYYGSQVAAPTAVKILERALKRLGEFPGPKEIDLAEASLATLLEREGKKTSGSRP